MVQEAFLRAFKNLHQFREDSQFSTWLVRIALNQSLMKVRKPHRKKEVAIEQDSETESGEPSIEAVDWTPNPEQRYQASELREILLKELNKLRPSLSLVFVLRDIEGLSTEQTSEVLGLSEAAIKARLMRARLQLRQQLSTCFRKSAQTLVTANQ